MTHGQARGPAGQVDQEFGQVDQEFGQVDHELGQVDHELVRRLLRDQHPDLADRPLSTVRGRAVGPDGGAQGEVALVRVGRHFAVRLPLDPGGADRLEREVRSLAQVAARTGADAGTRTATGKGVRPGPGVAVPRQVRAGEPTAYYPWPWSIIRWIPGRPATGQAVAARANWSSRLARFLADLHGQAPGEAPTGEVAEGLLLADHDAAVRARLAEPVALGALAGRADEVAELWDRLLAGTPALPDPAPWVHGRLDPQHLLVERGRLVGVTGFGGRRPGGSDPRGVGSAAVGSGAVGSGGVGQGGIGPGDLAADLATAWLTFDLEGRVGFVVRYSRLTGADDGWWLRARAWTVVRAMELLAVPGPSDREADEGGSEEADEGVTGDEGAAAVATGAHAIRQLLDAPDALSRLMTSR